MCVVEDHRDKNEYELEDMQDVFQSRKQGLKRELTQLRHRILQIKQSKDFASEEMKTLANRKKAFSVKVEKLFNRRLKNLKEQSRRAAR